MTDILSAITWTSEPETWGANLTTEQQALMAATPSAPEGAVAVMTISLDGVSLIQALPVDWWEGSAGESEDEYVVRFGHMPREVYMNLPEFQGF